jgi:hypothetical protein
MGNNIQDLWIMQEGGAVLFKHTQSEKIDPQLFGGFMSALNSMAATFSQDGLNNFELGELRFFVLKHKGLIFVANTKKKVKPKLVEKDIQNNITKFIKKYPEEVIQNWNGDLAFFNSFKAEIEDTFETPLEKLKQSLW